MQAEYTQAHLETDLQVSFKRDSSQFLLSMFFSEMRSLLKIMGINGELISQSIDDNQNAKSFASNLNVELKRAGQLLGQFGSIQRAEGTVHPQFTIEDPNMIFKEVADVGGLQSNLVVRNEERIKVKACHEELVKALTVLIEMSIKADNVPISVDVYKKGVGTDIKLSFQKNLSHCSESSISMQYVIEQLRLMDAEYSRGTRHIIIHFKEAYHEMA